MEAFQPYLFVDSPCQSLQPLPQNTHQLDMQCGPSLRLGDQTWSNDIWVRGLQQPMENGIWILLSAASTTIPLLLPLSACPPHIAYLPKSPPRQQQERKKKKKMASNALRSCGFASVFPTLLSSSRSKFTTTVALPNAYSNASSRFAMSAEWMPGQPRPPYLDGSAPG